jgi:hypothetical protein
MAVFGPSPARREVRKDGVRLLATAIEEGRDLSSMSGILAAACRLLLA